MHDSVVDECTLTEVKSLLSELIDEKKEELQKLTTRLGELKEKSHIIDDKAESNNK